MFAAPLATKMKTAIARPFVLLFKELIVLLMSLYAAFIYGILYLVSFLRLNSLSLSAPMLISTTPCRCSELSLSYSSKIEDGQLDSHRFLSSVSVW